MLRTGSLLVLWASWTQAPLAFRARFLEASPFSGSLKSWAQDVWSKHLISQRETEGWKFLPDSMAQTEDMVFGENVSQLS